MSFLLAFIISSTTFFSQNGSDFSNIGGISDTGDALQSALIHQELATDSIEVLSDGDITYGDEINDFIRQHKDPSTGGDNGVYGMVNEDGVVETAKEDMQLGTSALQFNEAVLYNTHYTPTTSHYTYSTH